MCLLHIHAQSQSRILEVLPEEPEIAEFAVEEMVSQVLLDLFGGGAVDEVAVHFSFSPCQALHCCSIHVYAQCSCESFKLLPCTMENMGIAVQTSMCSLLKELFGPVEVDSVTLYPTVHNNENDSVLWQRTGRF